MTRRYWLLLALCVVGIVVGQLRANGTPSKMSVPTPAVLARLLEQPARFMEPADAAITQGVAFGRADDIDHQLQDAYRQSGLWHLFAASGQNIALVVIMAMIAARALGAGPGWGTAAAAVAIPAYVSLVGGGASIVRAGIMGEIGLAAWAMGRLHDTVDAVLVAAALCIWIAPGSERTLGFQLSFACVGAMLWQCEPWTRGLARRGLPAWLAAGMAATAVCAVATAPILALTVERVPVLGGILNLIAVPAAGLLLVLGLTASLLALVLPVAALPVFVTAAVPARLLSWAGTTAAQLPFSSLETPTTRDKALVVCASAVAVGWGPLRERIRQATGSSPWHQPQWLLGAAVAVAGVILLVPNGSGGIAHALPADGLLRVSFLDVGQGDATLIQYGDHAVLVDTGVAAARIGQRLHDAGIGRLDGVILTHAEDDHIGGFADVRSRLHPGWVAGPAQGPQAWTGHAEGTRTVRVCRGQTLALQDVRVTVEHPDCQRVMSVTGDVANDNAVIVRVQLGAVAVLLTADAESPVTIPSAEPAQVLKVAHHGSSDPMLTGLLARVRPRLAVISVGANNRFGHPRADTLDTLRDAGVPTLRTDRQGTVTVTTDGRSLWVSEQRR